MTVEEIHASILLKVDRDNDFLRENFVPKEIDDFVNDAVDEYIDRQQKQLRRENSDLNSSEAQENLRTLINSADITNFGSPSILENGWKIDLTNISDYRYYIRGNAIDSSGNVNTMRLVSTSFLMDLGRNAYMNRFDRGIPVSIEDNEIIGVFPLERSKTPSSADISYIKTPNDVSLENNTGVDLPEHTHREIVDIAAQKIIRSFSGQTARSKQQTESN
jgi:hypothetical protein